MKPAIAARFGLVLALACGHTDANHADGKSAGGELTVYAATSLRDALQEIAPLYTDSPGLKIVFNFGSSGDLARQIIAAAQADVFFSADEIEMDRLAAEKLVDGGSRRSLLGNQMVLVQNRDTVTPNGFGPALLDVARSHSLVSLANPETVPAGRYAKAWLERRGLWEPLSSRIVPAIDARAALAAVESGAVPFGIVYKTDASRSRKVTITLDACPDDSPRVSYPVAALSNRPHLIQSRGFVEFLASPRAAEVFERCGFIVLAAGRAR